MEDPGNYKSVSLTLTPGKVVEQIVLEALSKHMKDKVIGSSQHGFRKRKSCQKDLKAFYGEMTSSVDEGILLILNLARLSAMSPIILSLRN